MNNKKYGAYFKNHAIIKNTNKAELRIKEFIMLDWLIDPDDDLDTEFWEYCEGVADEYVIDFIENKFNDDADLEEIVMMVFNHRGVQLPLRAEEITDYCYRQYNEQQLVREIKKYCPDVYDNLMDYVMDRVKDREALDCYDEDDRY